MRLGLLVLFTATYFAAYFVSGPAWAQLIYPASTIYGEDDRRMVNAGVPREIQQVSRSVAALFFARDVKFTDTKMIRPSASVGRAYEMCAKERFFTFPSSAECTGFLISPTRIATAGHCLKAPTTCADIIWAFDYTQGNYSWDGHRMGLPSANTYRCKKILAKHNNRSRDYAVIELDRPVEGRWPLQLADAAGLNAGDQIFSLGFPQGIPMIWSSVGSVRRHDGKLKVFAQIEMSEGNSGSPIFSSHSYDVLGILIEGEYDLRHNQKRSCKESVLCDENGCDGEVFISAEVLLPFVK